MDGKDLLRSLETVYVLPGDSLTFVTSREFSPDVSRYFMENLEKIFPEQKVNLISGVHTVLVERKLLTDEEELEEYDDKHYNGPIEACTCMGVVHICGSTLPSEH